VLEAGGRREDGLTEPPALPGGREADGQTEPPELASGQAGERASKAQQAAREAGRRCLLRGRAGMLRAGGCKRAGGRAGWLAGWLEEEERAPL
jgi:hypothetical protein